jgi:hypothetical protein
MGNSISFGGFVAPKKNYYHTPNEWIDICAAIDNLSELKVVQYVIRHTWGFHEYDGTPKPITTDEFMHGRKRHDGTRLDHGTGLSNRSVIDGLRKAIDHNYLICETDSTDKGRISKSYALNMAGKTDKPDVKHLHTENTCEDASHQTCNIFTSGVKDFHSCGEDSSYRTEKDTLEKHLRKTLKEKQGSLPPLPGNLTACVDAIAQRPASPLFADALVPGNEWEALLSIIPDTHPTAEQSSYSQTPTTKSGDELASHADVVVLPIGNIQSSIASTTSTAPSSATIVRGKDTSAPDLPVQQPPAPPALPPPPEEQSSRPKKPTMPDGSVAWNAETFVQVCEARRERRYPNGAKRKSERVRDTELAAATELLKPEMADIWTEDTAYNIALLCNICTQLETRKNKWWLETNGPVMPHQLLDKDRIHTMYDELVRLNQLRMLSPDRSDVATTPSTPGGDVAPPEQGLVGVSGRLRVISTGPLVVIPPRRAKPAKVQGQQPPASPLPQEEFVQRRA